MVDISIIILRTNQETINNRKDKNNKYTCVSKTHTPRPLFSKATFPSLTVCLYLLNSRDREWSLCQASKHNFGLLWLWPLTSWPPRSTVHTLAPEEDLCQVALKSVHSFSKYSVHKLVTDERTNKRTDGSRTLCVRPSSLDCIRINTVYVRCRYVAFMCFYHAERVLSAIAKFLCLSRHC